MGLFTVGQTVSRVGKEAKVVIRGPYEKKLDEYKKMLDAYQENLTAYESKLNTYGTTEADHMAAVQVALDLTYIKEELDEIKLNYDDGTKKQEELFLKIGRFDSAVVEPLKRISFENKNEIIGRVDNVLEVVQKNYKGLKFALGFSLLFNFISLGGIVFLIIYLMEFIWR